jgi:hypothetical protein
LAYEPVPTSLHFNASWRQPRFAVVPPVHDLVTIADSAPWWPAALRVQVEPGMPAQSAVFDALSHDPVAWCGSLRRAVSTVIDRLALEMTMTNVPPAL